MNPGIRLALMFAWMGCSAFAETIVRVENPTGSITVRVVAGEQDVQFRGSSPARQIRPDDVQLTRVVDLVTVRCQPSDGARIDLDLALSSTVGLDVATGSGAISFSGFLRQVRITTVSGDVKLAVPRQATFVVVFSQAKPKRQSLPRGTKFVQEGTQWALHDTVRTGPAFGTILVKATSLGQFDLADTPLPAGLQVPYYWPARDPSDALAILNKLREARTSTNPAVPADRQAQAIRTPSSGQEPRSDVRMVSLSGPAHDRDGHPVPGLGPADFEVLEDGVPQRVAFVGAGEVPFNLALLLSLRSNERATSPLMRGVAGKFIGVARPQDQVAVYALAESMFRVISPLTNDRRRLLDLTEGIDIVRRPARMSPAVLMPSTGRAYGDLSGLRRETEQRSYALPQILGLISLYGGTLLSYLEEFYDHRMERNALIIVSDGIDDGLRTYPPITIEMVRKAQNDCDTKGRDCGGVGMLSYSARQVRFEELLNAASEMNVMTYPVLVETTMPNVSAKARDNMQGLADATGGRLFPARSLQDLEPVYAQVADELRSVYTISYHPANQNFDGKYRRVEVRVKRLGAILRTRPGYYAW